MHTRLSSDADETEAMAEITLRDACDDDFPFLAELRRDLVLQSLLLTFPDNIDTESVIRWIERRRSEPGGTFQVVVHGRLGRAIGYIQVSQVHRRNRTGYGGIALASWARGQGFGRATLSALCDLSQTRLGLAKLLAEVRADNAPSMRVHMSSGYRVVGVLQRHFTDQDGRTHDVMLLERLLGGLQQ